MHIASDKPIALYKPLGMTPLQLVRQFALENDLVGKTGYAGRLDPLADGVVLGLFGLANKQQARLIDLDKRYRFTTVFGLTTDSYDLMGIPTIGNRVIELLSIDTLAASLIGTIDQSYPPYSAVRVSGKPLYYWARTGRLKDVAIPVARRIIFDLKVLATNKIASSDLLDKVDHNIGLVEGNFRQVEIALKWRELLGKTPAQYWPTATFELDCSSGTYVRSLVDMIGKELGCGATTLSLTRTAVGNYTLSDCWKVGRPERDGSPRA